VFPSTRGGVAQVHGCPAGERAAEPPRDLTSNRITGRQHRRAWPSSWRVVSIGGGLWRVPGARCPARVRSPRLRCPPDPPAARSRTRHHSRAGGSQAGHSLTAARGAARGPPGPRVRRCRGRRGRGLRAVAVGHARHRCTTRASSRGTPPRRQRARSGVRCPPVRHPGRRADLGAPAIAPGCVRTAATPPGPPQGARSRSRQHEGAAGPTAPCCRCFRRHQLRGRVRSRRSARLALKVARRSGCLPHPQPGGPVGPGRRRYTT